jgi:hypothetical protein
MKRIPILIPEEHHEALRKRSFENHTSIAEEIRKAIEEYLREGE